MQMELILLILIFMEEQAGYKLLHYNYCYYIEIYVV